ncbi:hypothetical protein [Salinarimonas sp.]|uniref:hypothetical protein n=1 Tax=Salinarimonas sp. TaxID=2766526 RepID=UPI0032D99FB7
MPRPLDRLVAICLATALLAAAPANAQDEASATPQAVFERVEAGDMSIADALDTLEDLPQSRSDPLSLAVRGTLLTMRAAEEWLPYNKLRSVNAGLELLDQAAARIDASHDDFLRVTMYAAVANAAVPGFLDRADFAKRYFNAVKEHASFDGMEAHTRASVYAWLARLEGTDTGAGEALLAQAKALDPAAADAIVNRE